MHIKQKNDSFIRQNNENNVIKMQYIYNLNRKVQNFKNYTKNTLRSNKIFLNKTCNYTGSSYSSNRNTAA